VLCFNLARQPGTGRRRELSLVGSAAWVATEPAFARTGHELLASPGFVGIDVSKDHLDVNVRPLCDPRCRLAGQQHATQMQIVLLI
jgi:hypothetical protein